MKRQITAIHNDLWGYEPDTTAQQTGSGIAVVSIKGPIGGGWFGVSPEMVQKALAVANGNAYKGVIIDVDSPGGSVSGLADLARSVSALAKVKPVYAYARGMMASAAYWAIAGATQVWASPTAQVGSIGAYIPITDTSKAAENAGVKVHLIGSGENKGAGEFGTQITDSHLAEMQALVSDLGDQFLATVKKARALSSSALKEIKTGKLFASSVAKDLGLVDSIGVFSDCESALIKAMSKQPKNRTQAALALLEVS